MDSSRRNFLKTAGLTLVGVSSTGAVVSALAGVSGRMEMSSKALLASRWAMAIDIKKCERKVGCTVCIDACHRLHNVPKIDDNEEEIKWIWKEPYLRTFPEEVHEYTEERVKNRNVPVLCNHCDNPPCVRVCPTRATFKRSDGLVMMDLHRCIGCRYCVVACPYGARSFNWRDPRPFIQNSNPLYPTRMKGVVEKCTFCADRLAAGQEPACVEACRKVAGVSAMTFGDLEDPSSEIREIVRSARIIRRKPGLGTHPQVYYIV